MPQFQKSISEFIGGATTTPVKPTDTVLSAMKVLATHADAYDCVLVVDGSALVGVFTERDFLNRVCARKLDPAKTSMEDVMTGNPFTLSSTDCITYAINQMAVGGFRNIPIVDDSDNPVAVLTARHVMKHMDQAFAAVSEATGPEWDEWHDIGGG